MNRILYIIVITCTHVDLESDRDTLKGKCCEIVIYKEKIKEVKELR